MEIRLPAQQQLPFGADIEILGDAASVRRYAAGPFMRRGARLELPEVRPRTLARWRSQLHRSERACGCREGAAAVFAAVFAILALHGAGVSLIAGPVSAPLVWLGVVFAAAAVGKLFGLAAAMARLRYLASAIGRWEAGDERL